MRRTRLNITGSNVSVDLDFEARLSNREGCSCIKSKTKLGQVDGSLGKSGSRPNSKVEIEFAAPGKRLGIEGTQADP